MDGVTMHSMSLLLAFLVALFTGVAAEQAPTDVIRWVVKAPPATVVPGQRLRLELTADIEPGWHVYATTQPPTGPQALVVSLDGSAAFELRAADIVTSPPKIEPDPNFEGDTQFYEDHATLIVPVTVKRTAARGKQ